MSRRSTSQFGNTGPQDQHSIPSPYLQTPYRPSFMKRPSRWSTSPTIQTAQGRGDIASWRRQRSRSVRSQFSASSLLSGTSLILSPSHIRTGSTPWLLVLRPHGIQDGRASSKSFELTSLDTYIVESQEASSTLLRRNSRLWRIATRRSPSHHLRKGNHVFQYPGSILF